MIKSYTKDLDYTYTQGFYPTFELLKYKKESLLNIYLHPKAEKSDAFKTLKSMGFEDKIIFSEKVFTKVGAKENDFCLGVFKKFQTKITKETTNEILVLVNPSDMGNLGNIFRTADAFGIRNMIIITPCADPFNPKVIRASMGSFFKINFELLPSFDDFNKKFSSYTPYFFALRNSKPLSSVEKPKTKYALVFGNEATGLPDEILTENTIKIEQDPNIDSLNLATAVAIGCYYFKYSLK